MLSSTVRVPRNQKHSQKNALESSQISFVFVDELNKSKYKKTVLAWLESDYHKKENPEGHFWHNRGLIEESFDDCTAMIALNEQGIFVSYMIWEFFDNDIGAEIHIIEVKKEYQKQGIFKKMITDFAEKFTDIAVLSARVLPQSREAFRKAGWEKQREKHTKTIKPSVLALNSLPDGQVIATCSENFYKVQNNPEQYKDLMKYFQIQLDNNGRLLTPVVTAYYYEHYIGIYLNKKLIAEGKAKHLFNYEDISGCSELLTLARIRPENPELFKDFLSVVQPIDTTAISTTTSLTNQPPLANPPLIFSSAAHSHKPALSKPIEDSFSEKKRTRSEGTKAKRRKNSIN